ncbi:MAG: isoaspartyl peptidase/L-asparaginase [Bacteroidetes bacterium]|nr:isoaspartyl peptidase/L-asparaginase [Bacteroidota bacterium]
MIAVHGGAGVILREDLSTELEKFFRAGISNAVAAGKKIILAGGSAVEAVEAAVNVMEDDPIFNAGRGSVYTHEGKCEMDAAIMDGKTRRAGAVAGITGVKNPTSLAKLVMEKSPHVFLCGKGAEDFARAQNVIFEEEKYFRTSFREEQWLKIKDSDDTAMDHSTGKKIGTVGAVAIDKNGNLAAATSTGGMTNKRWGRIGDSPVIGAGTFADDEVAVSCTGHGEFFIRYAVAHEISALIRYKKLSLKEAVHEVLHVQLKNAGGEGGLVAIDKNGKIIPDFNTPGMYRGWMDDAGNIKTEIFR